VQRRTEICERCQSALGVLRRWPYPDVEGFRCAHQAVRSQSVSSNDDELNATIVECS
jgi:hypothetical protein